MNDTWIINPTFGMFGWTSSIQKSKKGTTRITINKNVSIAASLKAGQRLYSYVGKEEGRPIMVTFLDGKPREDNHDGL